MCQGPEDFNTVASVASQVKVVAKEEIIDMSRLGGGFYQVNLTTLDEDYPDSISFDPLIDIVAELDESTAMTTTGANGDNSDTVRGEIDLRWYGINVVSREKFFSLHDYKQNNHSFVTIRKRDLLKNASGAVGTGQLLAVMGPSGAGKTTLLNLLAGRLTSSRNCEFSGRILVNGTKRDYNTFKKVSAYVMQDDDMFSEISVREHILFSARLRLPSSMKQKEIITRVNTVIRELGLSKVQHSKIGNQIIRGVSGGERKRVSIGVELVTNPLLIFLDEPTSGLDAFNALSVMISLRKLARNGRTVVSTIHQPRSNIYSLFDMLLLLANGKTMYFGPASQAINYFSSLSFECPDNYNPSDYYIDLMSFDSRSKETEDKCTRRINYLAKQHSQAMGETNNNATITIKLNCMTSLLDVESEAKSNWIFEFYELTVRNYKLMLRERRANGARLFQSLVFGLLLGMLWYKIGAKYNKSYLPEDIKTNVEALLGVLFFIAVMVGFSSTFAVVFDYPLEKSVVLRERASGTYRVSPYFFAKIAAEIPRTMTFSLIMALLLYFMIGLKLELMAFLIFWLILCAISMITETMTLCVSTITPDSQSSAAITPILIVLSLLFAGFFIKEAAMPRYIAWCRYLSFLKYGFAAIAINQFKGSIMGEFILQSEKLNQLGLYENISILLINIVFWRGLLYVILRLKGPSYNQQL